MNENPSNLAAPEPGPGELRAGMVAIVGRANVGKSSLLNNILGEKVSIVSPIAQTTRNLIRGILTEPRGQLVFLDTPGVHKATHDLGRIMNKVARSAIEGVDVILLVLDVTVPPREEDDGWMRKLIKLGGGCVIAFNKVDHGRTYIDALRQLWDKAVKELGETCSPGFLPPLKDPIWMEVSALTGQGIPELLTLLFDRVPCGPLLFPADVLTDYPRMINIADVIREKLYMHLRDELPHQVAVWIDSLDEQEGKWAVNGAIYVNQGSQKPIVLGEKGRRLRSVKRSSEGELSAMYGLPVRVNLWIKVEKHWSRNFWLLKKFGYVE
ncbi:MAG TPA: GTPase Era [Verrucomicrobia bacterium]|nr:MAG: GTPase Era [Lentisphaerae bacterium GWF2_57_35]HBA84775.1 GTPase Era [Verrucomicrobiota bacterium]